MKNLFTLLLLILPFVLNAQSWPSGLKGRWTFDDPANLLKATVGNDLVLDSNGTGVGVHEAIAGPDENDGAVSIKKGSFYHCIHDIPANGEGTKVNEYTLMVDFRIPVMGNWYSFLQTDLLNSNDGDYWVAPDGTIGIAPVGYSAFAVEAGKWYRLVIATDMGNSIKYYIDGQLIHTGIMTDPSTAIDGRWALSAGVGALNEVYLFADESGDDADFDIAQVAIFDTPLTEPEVAGLGKVIPDRLPVGQWTFDDPANLLKASIGVDLELDSTGTGAGRHEAIIGPKDNDGAVSIKRGSFYHCHHGIVPNGGGNYVNEYSLMIDFSVPAIGPWYSFFQTAPDNNNDAELFGNASGQIGVMPLGYTTVSGTADTWYRLVVTVDLGNAVNYYIDGQLVWSGNISDPSTGIDERWSLHHAAAGGLNDVLLFADNDGEDGDLNVAQVAIYNVPLTASEVAELGKVVKTAPEPVGLWDFDDPANLTKATIGNDLILDSIGTGDGINLAIEGPSALDGAVTVKKGSYYHCHHDILPNGEGEYVNEYTLLFDFRIPVLGPYYCFYQTNLDNTNDGDFWVDDLGRLGIFDLGYSGFTVDPGKWYRMVVSFDLGNNIKTYVNGQLISNATMGPGSGIDGRWAIEYFGGLNDVLFFADENAEDNDIDIAKLAIFDKALNSEEVALLGDFQKEDILPYLENPTPSSIYISWHNTKISETKVIYNTDSLSFPSSATGTYKNLDANIWNTVKLTDLSANTTYFYKCISGTDTSAIYAFHTPVAYDASEGHIRFAIIGDSQEHFDQSSKTATAIKSKFTELYGKNWYNEVNVIMHTGDIIQNSSINEFRKEYFEPFSKLSAYVPFMISAGNHEANNAPEAFYEYMHYDDFSDVQYPDALCEKYYAFNLGNVQFICTNSSRSDYQTTSQINWIEDKLNASKNDANTDFVFVMGHEAKSEIWPDGNNDWVYNTMFPVLANYPKIAQYSFGHSHNYEHGTYLGSNSENRDFRTLLFGGAGGTLDRWRMYANQKDLRDVYRSHDYYGYTIVDVDIANQSYTATSYSLGNDDKIMDNEIIETWHGVVNRSAPEKPVAELPAESTIELTPDLKASGFAGADEDSIMSSQFQIFTTQDDFSNALIDTIRHFANYYGANTTEVPINRNAGIDLTVYKVKSGILNAGNTYYWRVRYRDHNCRWSEWSDAKSLMINTTGIDKTEMTDKIHLYPNPVSVVLNVEGSGIERIEILSLQGVCVMRINNPAKSRNTIDVSSLEAGTYALKIYTSSGELTRKFIVNK